MTERLFYFNAFLLFSFGRILFSWDALVGLDAVSFEYGFVGGDGAFGV